MLQKDTSENIRVPTYHRSSSQDQRERGTHEGHFKALGEDAAKHDWPLTRFDDLKVYDPNPNYSKRELEENRLV